MAHTKAGGAAKRTVNVAGKRLGIKKFGGEFVKPGNIIVRQIGSKFHPGVNTMMGKDFTIFSTAAGVVNFRNMSGFKRTQSYVEVLAAEAAVSTKQAVKATKTEEVEVVAEAKETTETKSEPKAKTTKKPAAKKSVKASK